MRVLIRIYVVCMRVYPSIRASLVDHRIVSSSSSYDHNNMHLMIDRSYRYIEAQARSQVSPIFSFRRYLNPKP